MHAGHYVMVDFPSGESSPWPGLRDGSSHSNAFSSTAIATVRRIESSITTISGTQLSLQLGRNLSHCEYISWGFTEGSAGPCEAIFACAGLVGTAGTLGRWDFL